MTKKTYEYMNGPNAPRVVPTVRLNYQYKYDGKELQDELGLNMHDYGFRQYMPDIGRWGCMDEHSETYFQMSPYSYAVNNPVNMVDMFGLDPIYRNGKYYDNGAVVSWDYVQGWLQNHDGIAATYSFKTNAKGNTEIVGTESKTRRNNTFIYNGKKYTANSYMTLMGRDDTNNNVGDFKDIVELEMGYILQVLGQAEYVFKDLYNGDIEQAMYKESIGGILDYKNEVYKMFGFNRRSLLKINGIVYNPKEAGNFLWGMVLEYYGGVFSPNWVAEKGTPGRNDERWEQRAITNGRIFAEYLYKNRTKEMVKTVQMHRKSNR